MTDREQDLPARMSLAKEICAALAVRVRQSKQMTMGDLAVLRMTCASFADMLDIEKFEQIVDGADDGWEGFAALCERFALEGLPLERETTV